jgi:hypothetical protein
VKNFGLPLLLLGGGGYKPPNAARTWTRVTAKILDKEISEGSLSFFFSFSLSLSLSHLALLILPTFFSFLDIFLSLFLSTFSLPLSLPTCSYGPLLDIPDHVHFDRYAPGFSLKVPPTLMANKNHKHYLNEIKEKALRNISRISGRKEENEDEDEEEEEEEDEEDEESSKKSTKSEKESEK